MTTKSILASLLLTTALAAPAMAGAPQHEPGKHPGLPNYVLFDVGSFGGGFGLYSSPGVRALNRSGANVGLNATAADDPFGPDWCFADCHVDHAFEWKNGGTNDLGALKDGYSAFDTAINDQGLSTGVSQNGDVDAATTAPVAHGVRWQNGKIKDLGTLGGTQSEGVSLNRSGLIVADSSTADTNDPFINVPQANCLWLANNGTGCGQLDFGTNTLFLPVTTQTHGATWSKSESLKDLGTLGGPDSAAIDTNDAGQIVGWSYTSYDAGPSGVPDTHPFFWENGTMTDLGTLGGTFASAMLINGNGQVIGASNLAGDTVVHPFVWDTTTRTMQDLGSFGGWYSHPNWINDKGDVVGISSYPDDTRRAFYWHDGVLKDLGTLGRDARSVALSLNNHRVIVGYTFTKRGSELRGFVSDHGDTMVDLNELILKPHGLYVLAAYYINDRGEIIGFAQTKNGEIHPVVLVPEDDFATLATLRNAAGKMSNRATTARADSKHAAATQRLPGCAHGRARSCAER